MAQALRPLFVTVTWGAGGSTANKSLELAEICQRQLGLTTCLHLTCTNMSRSLIDDALEQAKLIPTRELEVIGFSRCGRTDRGVSAAGQVVSLWIRSALPQSETGQIAGPSGDDAYEREAEKDEQQRL